GGRLGFAENEGDKDKSKAELTKEELKKYFNPEFLNRVDEVVYFEPLSQEEIIQIVDIMLADFNKRLKDKKLMISMTEAAKKHMAEIGYDKNFGARPLRRIFQKEIEDYMAAQLLAGNYKMPTIIQMDVEEGKFIFLDRPWEDYGLDEGTNENQKEVASMS
ncbi:MAG: ATP-dependent Clp protease ATP-binding subunit, partial [Leptospiraceae bacterium]|nr:ATP-dependent Clp protease ATP-binding subunit [Leptospiraceae bacterium]